MKTFTLSLLFCIAFSVGYSQNINDNHVSFSYIQLPSVKIDEDYTLFETRVLHSYQQANQDSLNVFELRQQAAMQFFEASQARYLRQRDSLERLYLQQLAYWEKQSNAGVTTASGQPLPTPQPPIFPEPPAYPALKAPRLHSEYDENAITNAVSLQGFHNGINQIVLTVDLLPMQNIRIKQTKKGSGVSTKYHYQCEYIQPIRIILETPSQGILIQETLFQNTRSYKMKEHKSKYDHQLYMRSHGDAFYAELERYARQKAIADANSYINEQVGYIRKTRNTEIYSVKKFKNYDYSDLTNAYSATVRALNLVGNDRDCSGAQTELANAIKLWEEIMMESNTYDKKARINQKISTMIQCNIAEIQLWQTKFSEVTSNINLIKNSGVLKGKNHARRVDSFYQDFERRWKVNFPH